jgi:hypothetical protein
MCRFEQPEQNALHGRRMQEREPTVRILNRRAGLTQLKFGSQLQCFIQVVDLKAYVMQARPAPLDESTQLATDSSRAQQIEGGLSGAHDARSRLAGDLLPSHYLIPECAENRCHPIRFRQGQADMCESPDDGAAFAHDSLA